MLFVRGWWGGQRWVGKVARNPVVVRGIHRYVMFFVLAGALAKGWDGSRMLRDRDAGREVCL